MRKFLKQLGGVFILSFIALNAMSQNVNIRVKQNHWLTKSYTLNCTQSTFSIKVEYITTHTAIAYAYGAVVKHTGL